MGLIQVFTDGSSLGNPGPGGYGIILEFNGKKKELSKGFKQTTNNRMELLAVIVALESIKTDQHQIIVYSDSKYVVDSISKGWLDSWRKKQYKGKKNVDLWERFVPLKERLNVKFQWVKGHVGHPENERCDELAVSAASGKDLIEDTGFSV